jgi:hypothetical protein
MNHGELVFLAFAVGLADLPAPAVTDLPGEPVPGPLHGELLVQTPSYTAASLGSIEPNDL